jgi:GNAT superfamily N-acetyltransferase
MNNKTSITELRIDEIPSSLKDFFHQAEPQLKRCHAVLDGVAPDGKIYADDREKPSWAAVQEYYDHTLYFAGETSQAIITEVIAAVRKQNDVIIGMWLDDLRLTLLPTGSYYDGFAIEFYDRPIGKDLESLLADIPTGCEIKKLDRNLIMNTEWGPGDVEAAGSIENWEQGHLGYCLIRNGEIVSEASAGPPSRGMYEPGVFTKEAHRGNGYGTLVSAKLIQEIESKGGVTYWNCAAQNQPSVGVAKKLGYQVMLMVCTYPNTAHCL